MFFMVPQWVLVVSDGVLPLRQVGEAFPEVYLRGGIMERGNFLAAAGFASGGRQAVYSTFAAFQEPQNEAKTKGKGPNVSFF